MAVLLTKTLALLILALTVLISSCFPFSYSLSTVAISETSEQTLICALVQSPDSQQPYLNCVNFPGGIQVPLSSLLNSSSVSGIVAGNGFVCALRSSASIMGCTRFSANNNSTDDVSYKRLYIGPPLDELEAGNTHVCGLVNGGLECWQWEEFNSNSNSTGNHGNFSSVAVGEDFVCGLSEFGNIKCLEAGENINGNSSIIGHEPGGNYSVIGAGFHHACAISLNGGSLECWGDTTGHEKPPQGEFATLALAENRGCALRPNGTVACWGEKNFSLPERLRSTYFISIEAKQRVFCGVTVSNFSLFCWGNEILENSNAAVFTDVMPGPCRSACPCGPMPGYGAFCGQGLMICEPCAIRTLPPNESQPEAAVQPPSPSQETTRGGGCWTKKMVAFLVVGCFGSLSLVIVCCFFFFQYCNVRARRVHDSGRLDVETGPPDQAPPPAAATPVLEKRLSELASMGNGGNLEEFPLQLLHQATNNFSDDHKIGTGSFGSVYHATLDDGRQVAIKRAETSASSSHVCGTKRQEDKDIAFVNELESLSRLNHKNLVRLLGYCEESGELILVYEYMKNGTLHDHLHKLKSSQLTSWPGRIKVALDAARGIEYLHVYTVPQIIHRDIKSSNILLDDTWTAKVSDFGLSLMGPLDEEAHLSLGAAGTVGYMDPEYFRSQQLTATSDVYSFGVVLLELLSGYKAIHKNENGVPRNVVDFVAPYIVQDEIHRVLDPNVPPPTPFEIEAVAYVGYIAVDCVTQEGRDRPTITEIVNSLERALAACFAPSPPLSPSTTGSLT